MRQLLAVLVLAGGCGGRSRGGDRDGGNVESDAGLDVDAGSEGGSILCDDGLNDCPWSFPYCCFPDEGGPPGMCTDDPGDYERDDCVEGFCWVCRERARPSSIQPFDCVEPGVFRSDLCPEGFPHCCIYSGGVELCADHVLHGWRCDE